MDLQENPNFGDPKSWLSDHNSSPTHPRTQSSSLAPTPSANLDRDLFKDLVEIVPLVQSLIVLSLSLSLSIKLGFLSNC